MKLYLSSTAAVTDWDGLKSVLSGVRGTTLLTAVLLLVVGIVTVRIAMRLIRRAMLKSRLERGPVRFILSAIRFVLYFLVIVIVASYLGIDMSSFVALLSVVSLAVSLSVQSVLSNVAGGMMLIGSKPFRQGDFVAVDGEEATVDDIGVVYTRMHTVDNRRVLIPNSKLMDATLENYTALGKRRIETEESDDELGRLARVFNRMLDRLERSFEAERRFTADASHELRTPTAVILAQTEYSLERDRSPGEYREALRTVQKQGRRMSTLIDDMLDYTRLEQSPERYPFAVLDLSRLTQEAAEEFAMLGVRGIAIHTEVEPDVYVSGSAMLLSRLLRNLLSNAVRYGKENGCVQIGLRSAEGKAILSVRDDGIGVAPEERERIFERFYRSDSSRSVQGTGLGLPMVRRIAQLHGGTVELESEVGRGSTFRVVFPTAKEESL